MIVFFTGAYPPDKCGVGDYIFNLNKALKLSSKTIIFNLALFHYAWYLIKNNKKISLVNIQYPTIGYARNKFVAFYPHLAFLFSTLLKIRTSITLHEYSSLSPRAKFFISIYKRCYKIIVTNEYEQDCLVEHGFNRDNIEIIPISSNIPKAEKIHKKYDIIYFGILSKGKGIEDFLDVVEHFVKQQISCSVAFIGFKPDIDIEYEDEILNRARSSAIHLILNKEPEEISTVLASSSIALLPFPDGISERRGTALAAMLNDVLVITNDGPYANKFKSMCVLSDSKDALIKNTVIYHENPTQSEPLVENARAYAMSLSWDEIANKYKGIAHENHHQ